MKIKSMSWCDVYFLLYLNFIDNVISFIYILFYGLDFIVWIERLGLRIWGVYYYLKKNIIIDII